jgi:hypothetical protein
MRWSQGVWSERRLTQAVNIIDKNGHILPYVRFEGESLEFTPEALQILDELSRQESRAK